MMPRSQSKTAACRRDPASRLRAVFESQNSLRLIARAKETPRPPTQRHDSPNHCRGRGASVSPASSTAAGGVRTPRNRAFETRCRRSKNVNNRRRTWWLFCLMAVVTVCFAPSNAKADEPNSAELIVVVGAAGTPEYAKLFSEWAGKWRTAAEAARATLTVIGLDDAKISDRDRVQATLKSTSQESLRELWIVLIGHGTFDRRTAKFNLRGPDFSAGDLKDWLSPIRRPLVLIDTSAASAPFLTTLAGPNRVIISATKSGGEQNFARFGGFLADALTDAAADLDKDEQTSLWEAYLAASRKTVAWYKDEGLLLTEHALLDDNGDGQGTRSDSFDGLEPVEAPTGKETFDGSRAHQRHLVPSRQDAQLPLAIRQQRDALELQILDLRTKHATLSEDEYYERLEALLIDLTRLSRESAPEAAPPRPAAAR